MKWLLAFAFIFIPQYAFAAPDAETVYILNTLSFLMHGFLVMLMAAGFTMLEAGLVRGKNVTAQVAKNITLFSLAVVVYWLLGYDLMYTDVGSYIGTPGVWLPDDTAALAGDMSAGYGSASDWFFQAMFVAATASIVSGTVAERAKLSSFFIFVVVLTGLIYPIQAAWSWGGGFLSTLGFIDFAGSTIVHSVGGWAALMGAIIIGAREGKYPKSGGVRPILGSNMPLATLGTFLLWFGWYGFNGGSQLAMGSAADAIAIGSIYFNTTLAAAAGVIVAVVLTRLRYGKIDLTMALNGALGGLVAITAEPLSPTPAVALMIGAAGGVLVVLSVPLLDRLKIDDVVGAIPVHLICGIWGTIAVVFSNADANLASQLSGIVAVGLFVIITSSLAWLALKFTLGVRVGLQQEIDGLDLSECGLEFCPDSIPRT